MALGRFCQLFFVTLLLVGCGLTDGVPERRQEGAVISLNPIPEEPGVAPEEESTSAPTGVPTAIFKLEPVPPMILQIVPVSGETGVEPASTVEAHFSEAMDPATINEGNFLVSDSEAQILGTVAYDATTYAATFTPERNLALLRTYTVTLKQEVANAAGTALTSGRSWSFSTRDGSWSTPVVIGSAAASGYLSYPRIVMNTEGEAMAVWMGMSGSSFYLYGNRFVPGRGWMSATLIEKDKFYGRSTFDVAVSDSGRAVVTWDYPLGAPTTPPDSFAMIYDPAIGWTERILLDDDQADRSVAPTVGMDAEGNAIVAWSEDPPDGGQNERVFWRRFTPGGGWSAAAKLDERSGRACCENKIAMAQNGVATLIWRHDGTSYSARYISDQGWGAVMSASGGFGGFNPRLAMNENGDAAAVWNNGSTLWSNHFSGFDGLWGSAEALLSGHASLNVGNIAIDPSGNALAGWTEGVSGVCRAYSAHYDGGSGWSISERMEAGTCVLYRDPPSLALDGFGRGFSIWVQNNEAQPSIHAYRFLPDSGWQGDQLIEFDDRGAASEPQVAMIPSGSAVAIWVQNDGSANQVYASHFE